MQNEQVKKINISMLNYGEIISLEALWRGYSYYLKQVDLRGNNKDDIIELFLGNYCQNGICLYNENDNWYTYCFQDGIKVGEKAFNTCYDACVSILGEFSKQINDYDDVLANIFSGHVKGLHSDAEIDNFIRESIKVKRI